MDDDDIFNNVINVPQQPQQPPQPIQKSNGGDIFEMGLGGISF